MSEIDKKRILLEKRQQSHLEAFTNKLVQLIIEHTNNDDDFNEIDENELDFETKCEEMRSELISLMMDEFNTLDSVHSEYYENIITNIMLDRVQRAFARNQASDRIRREISKYNSLMGAEILTFDFNPENLIMSKIDDVFMIKQVCGALGIPEFSDEISSEYIKNMFTKVKK